jgi:hypothetical protein
MDLQRRRGVLVRMTAGGWKLETARITNSPAELRRQIAHGRCGLTGVIWWFAAVRRGQGSSREVARRSSSSSHPGGRSAARPVCVVAVAALGARCVGEVGGVAFSVNGRVTARGGSGVWFGCGLLSAQGSVLSPFVAPSEVFGVAHRSSSTISKDNPHRGRHDRNPCDRCSGGGGKQW